MGMPSLVERAYPADYQIPLLLKEQQRKLLLHPEIGLEDDFRRIYLNNDYSLGWPLGARRIFEELALNNTNAIIGVQIGDEGKGRIVDNLIQELIPNVERVYVVRFSGGANAGHTVEKGDIKLALHQVPSGVMSGETIGIIDRGTAIHAEDFATEIEYAENITGESLRDRLFLSRNALCITDLERAEETLMKFKKGRKGTTGRGIGPAYKNVYTYTPIEMRYLLEDDWEERFGKQYDQLALEFSLFPDPEDPNGNPRNLADVFVPDYAETVKSGKAAKRTVGDKGTYLERLRKTREWLIDRNIVQDTLVIHKEVIENIDKYGVVFEGSQAVGLHPWLGTKDDNSASDTSTYGVLGGTGIWRPDDIANRVGVIKATYMSDVGYRVMPTKVDIGEVKTVTELYEKYTNPTPDQIWAAWVREKFKEFGTTTGRPRHINHIDLSLISYNCWMGGTEVLAFTHLDTAREDENIKVCTHYTDRQGNIVTYRPGLEYQKNVIPHYIELPGWDGEAVARAKTFDELPENAKKYMAFLQARLGIPIVIATTGPKRENMLDIPSVEKNKIIYVNDESPATFSALMREHRLAVESGRQRRN